MVIAGELIALTIVVLIAVLEYRVMRNCVLEKNNVEEQLNSYCHKVYVAKEKLPKGTVLSEENLYQEIRYSDLPEESFISEEQFGMPVTLDIPEGTCLTKNMLSHGKQNVRELVLSEIKLTEHLQTGDRIDIRIRYSNAEDYIVLTEKCITKFDSGEGILVQLTEEELLLLASAIADSREYNNTWLYAAKYPEYTETDNRQGNYIANQDVLLLLGREKTEGESRDALERRLMQN